MLSDRLLHEGHEAETLALAGGGVSDYLCRLNSAEVVLKMPSEVVLS